MTDGRDESLGRVIGWRRRSACGAGRVPHGGRVDSRARRALRVAGRVASGARIPPTGTGAVAWFLVPASSTVALTEAQQRAVADQGVAVDDLGMARVRAIGLTAVSRDLQSHPAALQADRAEGDTGLPDGVR